MSFFFVFVYFQTLSVQYAAFNVEDGPEEEHPMLLHTCLSDEGDAYDEGDADAYEESDSYVVECITVNDEDSDRVPLVHVDAAAGATDPQVDAAACGGGSEENIVPDYNPPDVDQEEGLDDLLEQIQSVIQEENYADLADDFNHTVDCIAGVTVDIADDETVDVLQDDTGPCDEDALYPGSSRKLGVAMLLLCVVMIRFRLSAETMQWLLSLISLLLPENNKLISSMYGLRRYLKRLTFLPEINYFCSECYTHCGKDAVTCAICSGDLTKPGAVSYFIQHKLITQLQLLFKRKSFTEAVRTHRFSRNVPQGCIQDVYDGEIYQKLFNSGFLKDKNNLSFAMNTDGVAIFKSSKISMWPVYLLVNELPLKERKKRENTLFYGIWLSSKKPMMWSFLKPLFEEIKTFETDGADMVDHDGISFTCHATLLTCTCDLPAKALVCNSMQFNGAFSCWHCLQSGKTEKTDKGGHVHAFPFQETNPSGPPRTHESVKADVEKVIENIRDGKSEYVVNGIKGPQCFMFLKYFDFVNGYIIDYMHGVCSGVMKLLLMLWFSKDLKNSTFSFHIARERVNLALSNIKPTIEITRVPRSLDDIVHWKASEFRSFLLYWGLPVLSKVLSQQYLFHFCLLVKAIYLLSKDTIYPEDLEQAELLLFTFVEDFADLYTVRYMTMNVHQLVHLSDMVRKTGPLFVNNCFIFEDLNGFIVSHIHGTQGVDSQLMRTINLIHAIPILQEKFYGIDEEADAFLDTLQGTSHSTWKSINGENGIYAIGQRIAVDVQPTEKMAIQKLIPSFSDSNVIYWLKIYITSSNSYVYGSQYKRLKRRNQSVVKYEEMGTYKYGIVKYFAECVDASKTTHNVALIAPFRLQNEYDGKDHIHLVFQSNEVHAIFLNKISTSSVYVNTGEGEYVCDVPNRHDKD